MEIEKIHWKTEEAFKRIKSGKPVVLQNCPLVFPAHQNWTVDNLLRLMNEDFQCTVYVSSDKLYPYYEMSRNIGSYPFQPHFRKESMTMRDFCRCTQSSETTSKNYCYLNQNLVVEMGPKIAEEYSKFHLQTATLYQKLAGWDEMMHNLLMIGQEGFISTLHYDEAENLYSQLQGRKRVRLFPADCWEYLYPFPTSHPRDRQSQVPLPKQPGSTELENPLDRLAFPLFPKAAMQEMYVDLEPGEILYIPQYYFHQMESLSENVSLSWWFKHITRRQVNAAKETLHKDLLTSAVRRNVENMMVQMMGGGRPAHYLFLAVAAGVIRLDEIASTLPPVPTTTTQGDSESKASASTAAVPSSSSSGSSGASRSSRRSATPSSQPPGYCDTGGDDDAVEEVSPVSPTSSLIDSTETLSLQQRGATENNVSQEDDTFAWDTRTAQRMMPLIAALDKRLVVHVLRTTLAMLQTLFPLDDAVEFLQATVIGRFSADQLQDC